MNKKKFVKFFFALIILAAFVILTYLKLFTNNVIEVAEEKNSNETYNTNIIEDVEYTTRDKDGNEYLIKAKQGEIDFSNPSIIFLSKVNALIKLTDSEEVVIVSDFGKYNSENYDTIFSKNVIINYLDNKITGEYLDFSLERNSMIISKNVIYNNVENVLEADLVEINIKTKDTKILMYEQEKKVSIKSEDVGYNSNIIENVNYTTKDADGNEYFINAIQGEIDYSNSNIIYLKKVKANIKLKNSENILITSDFGKYNSDNFDTIFSKNVIINYLDNKINGEYLDFSLIRNSMIISKNLIYTNLENVLKADVIEIDIKTKDAKIFMYEKDKKVNIKNNN